MAVFCQQCSIDVWDEDTKDMASLTTIEEEAKGLYVEILCEGCGIIQVDHDGRCVTNNCLKEHGLKDKKER